MTVTSIDDGNVYFRVDGLKAYSHGYNVKMSANNAVMNAVCLRDWCDKHPEDVKP